VNCNSDLLLLCMIQHEQVQKGLKRSKTVSSVDGHNVSTYKQPMGIDPERLHIDTSAYMGETPIPLPTRLILAWNNIT
jgi:hypothetical protein